VRGWPRSPYPSSCLVAALMASVTGSPDSPDTPARRRTVATGSVAEGGANQACRPGSACAEQRTVQGLKGQCSCAIALHLGLPCDPESAMALCLAGCRGMGSLNAVWTAA
jgi:hypothetical protein